jgi:tetratricopeptide (TPR) repeat protein
MSRYVGEEWTLTMPIIASLRAILPSLALALTAGAAFADAAQDCRATTLTAEERATACRSADGEAESYEQLAFTHLDAGRPEDALAAARRAVEIANTLTLGSREEAQTAAPRMVPLDPKYEPAQGFLLQALAETGAVDEAIAAYREARAAGIEDTAGHLANGLAWGLYRVGEHETALPVIEDWLTAHPEPMGNPEYHFMVDTAAHIMAAAGQADRAVDTFLRAVELGGTGERIFYETQLTNLGFSPGEDDAGFEAALRACVATGEACRLF